ncbi:hypothetical protein N9174_00895, partial [bacterium]|nr:hypothetical protein [bacterium]
EKDEHLHIEFKDQRPTFKAKDANQFLMPFDEHQLSTGLPFFHRLLRDMGGILSTSQERDYTVFTVSLPKVYRRD